MVSASFSDKATKVYSGVRVKWHDPEAGETIVSELDAGLDPDQAKSADVLNITTRVETQAQADEVAKAALQEYGSKELEGSLSFEGRPFMVAGVRIFLEGFGVMDGQWTIKESTHTISGSGYSTSVAVKRGR